MKQRYSFFLALAAAPALEGGATAQEARNVFDAATVQLEKNVAPFRRLFDLDLDGDPDALGAQLISDASQYRLRLYRNDGQGVYSSIWGASATISGGTANELLIHTGRLNADAFPDFCIVYRTERHDWLGAGNGTFAPQPVITLPEPARKLALADLDLDGIDDFIWVATRTLYVTVSTGATVSMESAGTKHGLRVLPGNGPAGVTVILVHQNNNVRIHYASPAGLANGPLFMHGLSSSMMDTGDVDGDGDVDAVVFGPTSYSVLRRSAPGSWDLEPPVIGGPAEFLRDVDGDGDLDGACCGGGGGGGGSYPDNVLPTDFQLALNDGSGAFAPAFPIPGLGSPQLAGVADVDGDGDPDLVAGRCVVFNRGGFEPPAEGALVPPVSGPRTLSDCDGDGDVDVGFSVDSVYDNDGTGRFTLEDPALIPAPPGTAYAGPGYPGDFDGDGDVDLVVELRRLGRSQGYTGSLPGHDGTVSMALLRNNGAGALLTPLPASERGLSFVLDSADPELSLLVDADQDGDLDLLTRTLDYGFHHARTRFWANEGAGFFRGGGRERVYRSLWAGDVDQDGDMDMIAAGSGYGGTSTYLLLGSDPTPGRLPTLTWDSRPGYWPHEAATGLVEADFDADGYPDFASQSGLPGTSSEALVHNNRFPYGASLAANLGMNDGHALVPLARVTLGDLDGNSTVDGLAGVLDGELAQISRLHLKRTVGPVNTSSFDVALQLVPPGQLVDLDGDGDLDLLGTRIVFNRSN